MAEFAATHGRSCRGRDLVIPASTATDWCSRQRLADMIVAPRTRPGPRRRGGTGRERAGMLASLNAHGLADGPARVRPLLRTRAAAQRPDVPSLTENRGQIPPRAFSGLTSRVHSRHREIRPRQQAGAGVAGPYAAESPVAAGPVRTHRYSLTPMSGLGSLQVRY
jgi:hypothetical protein